MARLDHIQLMVRDWRRGQLGFSADDVAAKGGG